MTTNAGPIAEAHVRRMLQDSQEEIGRLMPDAVKRADHVFFITDPRSWKVQENDIPADQRAALVAHAAGKPLVALLPAATVLHLLRGLEEEIPAVVKVLREPRRPGVVPIVASFGEDIFAASYVATGTPDDFPDLVPVDRTEVVVHPPAGRQDVIPNPDDPDGYLLTLEGALRLYYETAPDEVKPEGRARLVAFKERGRAALVAEAMRARPRDVGLVLVDMLGGDKLRADFRERGVAAIFGAIERLISARAS